MVRRARGLTQAYVAEQIGGSVRAFYDEDEKEWWLSAKDVIKILSGLSAGLSEALDKYLTPPKKDSKSNK